MIKRLFVILSVLLLLWGCESIPNLTSNSFTTSKALFQLDTGGHTAKINDVIVTRSGDIISASNDKTIRIWDSQTGQEKNKILGQIDSGSEGKISAIALSPNEQFLAVSGKLSNSVTNSGVIRIYNYPEGKLVRILKSHKNEIHDLAFSPKGDYLISGSADKTAKLWQTNKWQLSDTITTHDNDVQAVKLIEKDEELFAITAGLDKKVSRYSLRKKKAIKTISMEHQLYYLAVSTDHIAVCGDGKAIWVLDYTLDHFKVIPSEIVPTGLAYSLDGEVLISGSKGKTNNSVNVYFRPNNYQRVRSFKQHKNLVQAVAFLDRVTAVSAGGDSNEIYLWNMENTQIKQKMQGVGNVVWNVSVIADRIAWGNKWIRNEKQSKFRFQKSINLKDFVIQNPITDQQAFMRIAPDQDTIYADFMRNANFKQKMDKLLKSKSPFILMVRDMFDNGRQYRDVDDDNIYLHQQGLIFAGANGELKLYKFSGKEIANFVGHTSKVLSVAFDGNRMVSGSSDQTIRVWDLSQKKQQIQPQLNIFIAKNDEWIVWTPEGFYNASKGAEQYIGYHINQGKNKEAVFLDVSRFKKQFYRPDLIAKAIQGEDMRRYAKDIDIDSLLTTGLPPQVEILTASHTINNNTTEVGIKICDKGGGIENLNFYIDDKPIQYLSRNKAFHHQKQADKDCIIIEQNLTIPSGKHRITFNATNKVGNIISNTPAITITNTKVEERKPNLHLLTLSIQDYKDDSLDLTFPNNDADALSKKLKLIGKSVFGEVISYALKDNQVTQAQINAKIAEIAPNIGVNDVFVLYLSGHGITNKDDGDYYFIPYNAPNGSDVTQTAINQQQFKRLISQIKAVKSVILLDTCQSGTAASEALIDTSVKRFGGNVGTAIIAGATSQQDAIDGYKEHGIFTYTVLDAMDKTEHYGIDRKLSINEVAEYAKFLLPKLAKEKFGHTQNPTIYMNGDTSFPIGGL